MIGSSPEGSAKRRDAQLAKAESLVALKKFAEAEALVRGVIAGAPAEDATTEALAHNTLGDCLLAANRPKDALYAYLHTDLLFFKDKEEHPRPWPRSSRSGGSSSATTGPTRCWIGSRRSIPRARMSRRRGRSRGGEARPLASPGATSGSCLRLICDRWDPGHPRRVGPRITLGPN